MPFLGFYKVDDCRIEIPQTKGILAPVPETCCFFTTLGKVRRTSVITIEGFIILVHNKFFSSWLLTISKIDHMGIITGYITEMPSALTCRIKDCLSLIHYSP